MLAGLYGMWLRLGSIFLHLVGGTGVSQMGSHPGGSGTRGAKQGPVFLSPRFEETIHEELYVSLGMRSITLLPIAQP